MKRFATAFTLLVLAACASTRHIEGTKIEDTEDNRDIVRVIERYRRAMERRDAPALLAMAHPWYFEDSGTAKGDDDYGVQGLQKVLGDRLAQLKSIRYGIQYKQITRAGNRARVEIFIDGSYQMTAEGGDRWQRKADDNQIELIKDDKGWRFLSGM